MIGTILKDRDEGWALAPVIDWLFQGGRFLADSNELVRLLGVRLAEAGAPVIRIRVMMRTLHPLQTGWSASWEIDGRFERDNMATYGLEQQPGYIGSPFEYVERTRRPFRRRLDGGLNESDHPILHELASRSEEDRGLGGGPQSDPRCSRVEASRSHRGHDLYRSPQHLAQSARSPLAFGIGLHLGEIVYGNVGSPSRLDFTVMGQAVNLTARIEKLSRSLGHPIILSETLARTSGLSCADLGRHRIAGWDMAVQVYAPPLSPDGSPPPP